MNEIATCLRALGNDAPGEAYSLGFAARKRWARFEAETSQLRRLERREDYFGEYVHFSVAEPLFFFLSPDDGGDRDAAAWFWECQFCIDNPGNAVLCGFVDGALSTRS